MVGLEPTSNGLTDRPLTNWVHTYLDKIIHNKLYELL